MGISKYDPVAKGRPAWNAGKQVGAKRALKVKQIWSVVIQQKTGRPVQFEITADTRASLLAWLERRGGSVDDFAFPSRVGKQNGRFWKERRPRS